MSSLRDRLEALAALRTPAHPPVAPRPRPAPASSVSHQILEQTVPLSSRPGLDCLPQADPQSAALLTRDPSTQVPPLSDWLFLDLETTGLAGGAGTYAFLVGLGRLVPGALHVRQFFLHDLASEKELLAELTPCLRAASALVTYNGKTFDAPVLETRFRLGRLPFNSSTLLHLDLLYPARRLWKHHGPVRLTDLEHHLFGYTRLEDVPAERIPRIYFDYLRRGNSRALRPVFRHNVEDLVTLAALAARLLHLVSVWENPSANPAECFALARLFERARRLERARSLYEQALARGLPAGLERAAQLRISYLCKRQRDYRHAVALWEKLRQAGNGTAGGEALEVLEELAICYEHRLEDLEAAADATHQALARIASLLSGPAQDRARYHKMQERFQHRLRRLTRKLAPPPLLPLPCSPIGRPG